MNYIDGLDRVYVGDLKFNRKLQFQWPETADVDGLASVQYPDASTAAGPFEYAGSGSSDDDWTGLYGGPDRHPQPDSWVDSRTSRTRSLEFETIQGSLGPSLRMQKFTE